jgi:Cu/Ag efflux pump CusA
MMHAILECSVRFRLLVAAVAAALLFVGGSQLRKMPVEVLPDFTPTTVEVQTEALGLSAPEVEQLITVPIEQDLLNGVAFLKDIQSESVPGLSRILMIFQPGTSVFKARQVVAERLTQTAALPQVSKPPRMLQPLSSTNRVLLVGMTSRNLSLLQMGVLARWTIAPRLVGLPGVANVAVWGQEDRQLQVQVDPQRLRAKGVGLDELIETTANALWVSPLTFVEASTPGTGGFVETGNQRLGIQHESPITTAADLAKVRIEGTRRDLVLGDVADVIENHQPLIGDAVVNGKPGLLLVVQRFPGTNLLSVTKTVERALHQMQPGLNGIEFDTGVYRPASYVESSIDNLRLALWIGFGLLAAVLAACFFRLRTALVSLVVIPLSVVTAVLVLWAFGSTMNAIVVAGLVAALLLVIDDAVVTVERVAGRLRRQADDGAAEPPSRVVVDAVAEAGRPLLYATLIVGLAVVPFFFLERLSGAFFPDLAAAYLVALLSSLAVALTVTPALAALLLARAKRRNGASPLSSRLAEPYERALGWFLARSRLAYVALGGLLVLAAVSAPFLHQSLLPRFKESQLLIPWNGPPGTSLPEMNRITTRASRELASIPGVRDVGGHVGRAVTGDQIVGANSGELWVNVDPHADYDQTVAAVRRVVAGYPGLSHEVETYSGSQVQAALGGRSDDVVTRIYGENLQTLGAQAERVRTLMSGVDGIRGAHVVFSPEQPTLRVRVDLAKADRYGIKPGDVRRAATTLLSGLVVGSLFEQEKVFDVVVWGTPQVRNSLTSVRRLLIATPKGGYVRLGQVASVRIAPSPEVIRRQAVSRYVDVGASVSGRGRDAVVRDVQSRLRTLRFPIAYHAEVLAAERQPTWRLVSIAVAAIVGMFLLLQAFFTSWRLAALSLLALPIGAAGGLAAALVAGDALSFGSYIALFAAAAFAVRCGILLFARFRQLEQDEGEAFGAGLVLRGAGERLAPVATTAVAACAFLLPLLVMGNRPGLELVDPLAVVLVGGLVTTVPYALFVLPALYLRFAAGTATAPVEEERLTAVLDGLAKDAAADAGAASGATVR